MSYEIDLLKVDFKQLRESIVDCVDEPDEIAVAAAAVDQLETAVKHFHHVRNQYLTNRTGNNSQVELMAARKNVRNATIVLQYVTVNTTGGDVFYTSPIWDSNFVIPFDLTPEE